MDVDRYLRRIGSATLCGTDLATLRQLQRAHLYAVPFENLDIRCGRTLVLNEAALFDKIVGRRRSGICYELNALFSGLLKALGFRVSLLAAEVATTQASYGPSFDHMALLVVIGKRRLLADVGFGDSFLEPLDLDQCGEQPQDNGVYEIRPDGPSYVVMKRPHVEDGTAEPSFRFETRPRDLADFEPMCLYHQTSPESHFTRKDICSLATPEGRMTISGDQLIETRAGSRVVHELRHPEQRRLALRAHFGVVL